MTTDDAPKYIPRRGDEVEAWLERWQEAARGQFIRSEVIRFMLTEYRNKADAGVPLSEEAPS